MVFAKTAKIDKVHCHDCQVEITFQGKEIQNGLMLEYDNEGEKITIFKCKNCYSKNPSLANFQKCEVYSRIVGYLRPVQEWNLGKQEEYTDRKEFKNPKEESC